MTLEQHDKVIQLIMETAHAKPQTREWLRIACMHRSWINESHDPAVKQHREANERLEFLGDSVLGLIIAKELYTKLDHQDEGRLSKAKARLVSSKMLTTYAKRLDLGSALLLGHGEETTGGRQRASLLANTLEAIIGAVFLAEGFEKSERFVLELWKDDISREIRGSSGEDYKSLLQEYLQQKDGILPEYKVDGVSGPDHQRHYDVSVLIDGKIHGHGSGPSKKEAAQSAAAQAYQTLQNERTIGEDL